MNKESIETEFQSQDDQKSPSYPKRGISLSSIKIDANNESMISSEKMKSIMDKIITQEQKAATVNTTIITKLRNPNQLYLCSFLSPHRTSLEYNDTMLLPNKTSKKKKTLVLDLDETLVHSSLISPMYPSDIHLKLDYNGEPNDIYIVIRPGVNEFLKKMSELYELVLFTYANPVMDFIDKEGLCLYRLFREHCTQINKSFIKDLRKLNRSMKDIMLLDNSPIAYAFTKDNGLPIITWIDDQNDRELLKITPIIEFLSKVDDVRNYIPKFVIKNEISIVQAKIVIQNYHLAGDDMIHNSPSSPAYNYYEKSPIVQLNKNSSSNNIKRNHKEGYMPIEAKQSLKLKLTNLKLHNNLKIHNINLGNKSIGFDKNISPMSIVKTVLCTNNNNNNNSKQKEGEIEMKKMFHNELTNPKSFQTLQLNEKERQRKKRDTKNNLLPKYKALISLSPLLPNQINHYTNNLVNPYPNIECNNSNATNGIKKHAKSLNSFYTNDTNNIKADKRKMIDVDIVNDKFNSNQTMKDYYDQPSTHRIIDVVQQNTRQSNRTSSIGHLFNSGSATSLASCPSIKQIIPLISSNTHSTSNLNTNLKEIKSTKQSTSMSHHILIAKHANRKYHNHNNHTNNNNNNNSLIRKQKYSSISSIKYAALNKNNN